MSRLISVLAAFCALGAAALPQPSFAASTTKTNQLVHVLIQLKGSPLAADPNLKGRTPATMYRYRLDPSLPAAQQYSDALTNYQNQEIAYLARKGIDLSVGRHLRLVFNGFGAIVPVSQLAALHHLANVAAIFPVRQIRPLLDRSLPLVHAEEAWTQLGGPQAAGKGIRIADIDSGIDISNPCFSDAGFPASPIGRRSDTAANRSLTNNKVIVARAFGPDSTKQYSAADHSGHGTFTGAIEACDYNTLTPIGTRISGVAPAAYLMNYNVFPESGDSSDEAILGAIDAALLDGADVMNLSLGSIAGAGDLRLDPDSTAVNLAMKAGVAVVISAGNAGPTAQTVSSPAAAPDAIAVGAASNSRALYSSISVNGPGAVPADLTRIKSVEASYAWTGTIGPAQMVYVGYGRRPNDDPKKPNLDEFAGKDLTGKIALIQRGSDTGSPILFETKASNAEKAGAIAAIIFDNRKGQLRSIDVGKAKVRTMFITQDNGQALLDWLQAHPDAQVTMDSTITASDETPDVLTDFSSRGPSAGYVIKPDIVAPGQDIYSATQHQFSDGDLYNPSGFVSAEGTSFSGPHVTGAVALVLEKHPKWTPAMVKSALMNTAAPSVALVPGDSTPPSVMQVGAGLLDINAALAAPATLTPGSLSYGQINVGSGPVQQDVKLTLNDVSGGNGSWQVSVQQDHGTAGLTIGVPAAVALPAGGHVDLPVHLAAAATTAAGDYEGYLILQHNGVTLRAPYFVHVNNETVKPGSILLVDDTASLFQPDAGLPPVTHRDLTKWYTDALTAIGKTYTYWNEATLGTPSLQDMKRASAVIYFTGTNLNGFAPENTNIEALDPPMGSDDVTTLHSYLDGGGRLFVTGMGAALSDEYWTGIVLGANIESFSVFDNDNTDKDHTGGVSPPQPSAVPDTGTGALAHAGIFADLKGIDISTKGDGAGDNLAEYNRYLKTAIPTFSGMVGVSGMSAFSGNFGFQGNAYGQSVLKIADPNVTDGGTSVGIVSSDEPSLKHAAHYPGRSVLFSFGFEGINNNTGYATRAQILQRIFQWFDDRPSVRVSTTHVAAGQKIAFKATLRGPSRPAQYLWQVGGRLLAPSAKPTQYRFTRAGSYKVRVQVTDRLGHVAVSPWTTVIAR